MKIHIGLIQKAEADVSAGTSTSAVCHERKSDEGDDGEEA